MVGGVAVAVSGLPVDFLDRHDLRRRVHERGGEAEVQFLLRDREPVLPVWLDGRQRVLRWGNRRGQSRALPCTAWTQRGTVEAGRWAAHGAEEVVIPATLVLDNGVWYRVREGVRGVAVRDEGESPVVYPLVEPSSHYYQVMTRSEWMPVFIGQCI
jgi:hypothetical protein